MQLSIALFILLGATMMWINFQQSHKRNVTIAADSNGNVITAVQLNNANPYRIGAYVYVQENTMRSDMDWTGTVIGMSNGMVMVRDNDSNVVAHVNKDQVYGAKR